MGKGKPQSEPRDGLKDDYFNYIFRDARIKAGYTIYELAEIVGISSGMICHYERLRAYPSEITAKRIAIALNERLRKSDKIEDYAAELFPEHLKEMVNEIRKERRHSLEDALNYAVPIDRAITIQSPRSSENLPEIVQELYEERIEEIHPVQESQLETAQYHDLLSRIGKVLRTLSYREREIIELRYGLEDGHFYSQEEVGHIFKVTKERIRQIEAKALRKLQQPSRSQELVGFLD